jgi:hypothetical protein
LLDLGPPRAKINPAFRAFETVAWVELHRLITAENGTFWAFVGVLAAPNPKFFSFRMLPRGNFSGGIPVGRKPKG